jgi:very-short-patch-repair endonuclease
VAKGRPTTESIIAGLASQIAQQAAESFLEHLAHYDFHIEKWTPIERLMGYGLCFSITHNEYYGGNGGDIRFIDNNDAPTLEALLELPLQEGIFIAPQCKVGKYTADFLVRVQHWRGGRAVGVIECDGHDFHERTKEQAQHDNKRDREMQSRGLIVLRYTGSEIFRSPADAAFSALNIIHDAAGKK